MTLRLAEEQDRQLTEIAAAQGISKQKALARAVEKYIELEWQASRVKSTVETVLERDKGLLARLVEYGD